MNCLPLRWLLPRNEPGRERRALPSETALRRGLRFVNFIDEDEFFTGYPAVRVENLVPFLIFVAAGDETGSGYGTRVHERVARVSWHLHNRRHGIKRPTSRLRANALEYLVVAQFFHLNRIFADHRRCAVIYGLESRPHPTIHSPTATMFLAWRCSCFAGGRSGFFQEAGQDEHQHNAVKQWFETGLIVFEGQGLRAFRHRNQPRTEHRA